MPSGLAEIAHIYPYTPGKLGINFTEIFEKAAAGQDLQLTNTGSNRRISCETSLRKIDVRDIDKTPISLLGCDDYK
jgi:hypothetical protein